MHSTITGISSMATRQVLADLARLYEQRSGCKVTISSMGGKDAARKVRAGEPTDIIVLASDAMDELEAEGHVLLGTQVGFARSGIAVAVRSGAPPPNIDSEESVKRTVLDAERVCYSTGPSGDHVKKLWQKWGIFEDVSKRALQAPPGVPVGSLLATGEADLGFQQLSELMHLPGIQILGPLPSEIQATTTFSAGVCKASSQVEGARALIAYLTSAEASAAKRQHGMEPAELA